MALRFRSTALSRMAFISESCWATGRPGLEGQSMLATVATHAARNSRGGGGATEPTGGFFSKDWMERPVRRRAMRGRVMDRMGVRLREGEGECQTRRHEGAK